MWILCVEDSKPREVSEDLAKAFLSTYGKNVVVTDNEFVTVHQATKTILAQRVVFVKTRTPLA